MPAVFLANLGQRHDYDGTPNPSSGTHILRNGAPGAPNTLFLECYSESMASGTEITVAQLSSPGPFTVNATSHPMLITTFEVDITAADATFNPSQRSTITIKVEDNSATSNRILTVTNVNGGNLTLRDGDSVTLDLRSDTTYEPHSG